MLRAVRLDRRAAQPVMVLAQHWVDTGQPARASKLVLRALTEAPDSPELHQFAATLSGTPVLVDPDALRQVQAKQAVQQVQQIECPGCRTQVPDWTVVCPRCSTRLRVAPSTFASHDRGPARTWQEIAYYICSTLFLLAGLLDILLGLGAGAAGGQFAESFKTYFILVGGIQAALGIGLLFQVDWVMFVTKLLCYLRLLSGSISFVVALATGAWLGVAYQFALLCLTGLMVYLLGYMGD